MDVLVVMATSISYLYSVAVLVIFCLNLIAFKNNFVSKIVLTYSEKKMFYLSRKTLKIRGTRPRIFEIVYLIVTMIGQI